MLKRHEIQVLLKAGHSRAEVAQLTGVSIRSVKRVAKEAVITQVDDAAARVTRGIGRPSLVEDFRKPIADLLDQERDAQVRGGAASHAPRGVHRPEDRALRPHCGRPAEGPDAAGAV